MNAVTVGGDLSAMVANHKQDHRVVIRALDIPQQLGAIRATAGPSDLAGFVVTLLSTSGVQPVVVSACKRGFNSVASQYALLGDQSCVINRFDRFTDLALEHVKIMKS